MTIITIERLKGKIKKRVTERVEKVAALAAQQAITQVTMLTYDWRSEYAIEIKVGDKEIYICKPSNSIPFFQREEEAIFLSYHTAIELQQKALAVYYSPFGRREMELFSEPRFLELWDELGRNREEREREQRESSLEKEAAAELDRLRRLYYQ